MPDWFQPIHALIKSQEQRLSHLESLTQDNIRLCEALEAAQQRIKELEASRVQVTPPPQVSAAPKPLGTEASIWKSPAPDTSKSAPRPSYADAAIKGKQVPSPKKKTTLRSNKAPTKRQLQVVARTFKPVSDTQGYQYIYLPCRYREPISSARRKFQG